MTDNETIRELIEAAVAESFDAHLRELHDDIVSRVLREITQSLQTPPAAAAGTAAKGSAKDLNEVILTIQRASQQVEILKTLLEGSSCFSARTALFILRGNIAVGWQARGFADNDAIKAIMIESAGGIVGSVVHNYTIEQVSLSEVDPKFAHAMGAPTEDVCILIPLIVRGKVAAVLYADAGDEGVPVDIQAIELLSRAAGDWIELQALRKAAGAPAHYPVPTRSSRVSDPAPRSQVEPSPAPVPHEPAPAEVKKNEAQPAPTAAAPAPAPVETHPATPPPAAAATPAPAPAPEIAADDEELHKKARRFAKLLVDEIVLYNQGKVKEGRQHHDLYDRLKEDIEKSRATYDKRYGNTSAARADYFNQALITGLADHNPILLGNNFPR